MSEDTGPLYYIKSTHEGLDRWRWPTLVTERGYQGPNRDEDLERIYGRERLQPLTGKKGAVVMLDTKGIHKGGLVRDGCRQLAVIGYKSSSYTDKGLAAGIQGVPEDSHPIIRFAAAPNI